MPIETQRDLLDIFTKSARDFLDGWFEDDHVKSAFAFDAVVGNYAGVSTPGSAYVLLHHVFGEVNGKPGAWGHSVGGMGCDHPGDGLPPVSTPASRSAWKRRSQSCWWSCAARSGAAVGLLQSGEEIAARIVAANVGPALLYRRMVDVRRICPRISTSASRATRPAPARSV